MSAVERSAEQNGAIEARYSPAVRGTEPSAIDVLNNQLQRHYSPYREGEVDDGRIDPFRIFLGEVAQHPLLTFKQEVKFSTDYKRGLAAGERLKQKDGLSSQDIDDLQAQITRGTAARATLVASNLRLVISIAKRYQWSQVELVDLISLGSQGLLRAIDDFDPTLGFKFSTKATWWIRQAITRGIVDEGRTIKLPTQVADSVHRLHKMERQYMAYHGVHPDIETLRMLYESYTGDKAPFDTVMEVREAKLNAQLLSLDLPVTGVDKETSTLGEFIEDTDQETEDEAAKVADLQILQRYLDKLSEREKKVLQMRFGFGCEPMTLSQVGEELHVSRERIRQIEHEARVKLGTILPEEYRIQVKDHQEQSAAQQVSQPPEGHAKENGVIKEEPSEAATPRVVYSTLYDRAAEIVREGRVTDPVAQQILIMVAGADKDTFRKVVGKISSVYKIPRDDVPSRVLEIIDRLEQSA